MDYHLNKSTLTSLIALLTISTTVHASYAFEQPSWYTQKTWRLVFSFGGGIATSSDVGQSQNIPIHNPVTDEFYNYTFNHPTQTSGLGDIFIGAEWPLPSDFSLQSGFDYSQTSPFSAKSTFLQGADLASADQYTSNYHILTRQLLFTGKLLYAYKEIYHPYLLLGLGASFNKAYNYYSNVPPTLTLTRQYENNATSDFSYAVGIGLDGDIAPHIRLGIGYRFANLGQAKLGNATINGTPAMGTLSQSHLYVNEMLTQFTWIE